MKKKILFILICLVAMLLLAVSAFAAGGYDLSWWTVDGGGGISSGSGYTLTGTLGQPDAGALASGGGYALAGGFWHGGVVVLPKTMVYLPLLVK